MAMHCSNCYRELHDNWICCPKCGTAIDKAGGIDDATLDNLLVTREKTLDILETIIIELEKYGKLEVSTSLASSGAKVASALLWMLVPGKPVTVVADVVSSGLSVANSGVSLLTLWKENGLLQKANEVCKIDNKLWLRLGMVVPTVVEMIKSGTAPKVFHAKVKELNTLYKSGKWHEYSYKPTTKELRLSVFGNLAVFIARNIELYNGNYSRVAETLKAEREVLYSEYRSISSAPKAVRGMTWNKKSV